MVESAWELIDAMLEAGDLPAPGLLEAILVRGDEAVDPLMEVLQLGLEDPDRWEPDSINYAALLLGSLQARDAVPLLIRCLREELGSFLDMAEALGELGEPAVDPALELIDDEAAFPGAREAAVFAVGRVALKAPGVYERVTERLRARLSDYVERADALSDDDLLVAAAIVVVLAELRDPAAGESLERALAADVYDATLMSRDEIWAVHRGEAERLVLSEETSWLDDYRLEYEAITSRADQVDEPSPGPDAGAMAILPPSQPQRRTRRTIGRNDPCWCGSGKKYKHCHWLEDQRAGRG